MDHLVRTALSVGHLQRLEHELATQASIHRPTDDQTREHVEHDRQVQKALGRGDVELMSNLVYGLHDSGGFPADLSLVHSVNEFHAGDDIGKVAKAA